MVSCTGMYSHMHRRRARARGCGRECNGVGRAYQRRWCASIRRDTTQARCHACESASRCTGVKDVGSSSFLVRTGISRAASLIVQ